MTMICPRCNSPMSERVYTKESEQFKRGEKVYEGRTVRKYYKEYRYECMKCGHTEYRYDYVDLP